MWSALGGLNRSSSLGSSQCTTRERSRSGAPSINVRKHVDVLELDSSATIFHAGLSRLGRVVEELEGRVEVLEHENTALKQCLEAAEVLRPEAFAARLHHRQFSTTLSRHPCDWEASLSHLLLTQELRAVIGRFASWNVVRDCCSLERQLQELREKIPEVIYVCGGFDGNEILASMDKFDPFRQSETLREIPRQASSTSSESCICRRATQEDTEIVLTQGVWESAAPMAQSRAGFAATALCGLLYVCGGYDGKVFLRSVERFHPAAERGVWEPVPDMLQKRHCAAAAAVRGRLYVCGGYNGEEALSSTECYDPVQGTWELVEPMSQRRHGAAAAALDGKIYVCGGYDGEQALLSVERYDPERRIWEFMPSLQQRRNVAFAVVVHKKLYVCSGCNGAETLKTMECFNPELNVWELVPPMEQKRHGAAAAAANGQLFVCGGGDSADTPGRLLDSAELYDPRKRDWTAATPMANIRIDMAAVSLLTPV